MPNKLELKPVGMMMYGDGNRDEARAFEEAMRVGDHLIRGKITPEQRNEWVRRIYSQYLSDSLTPVEESFDSKYEGRRA